MKIVQAEIYEDEAELGLAQRGDTLHTHTYLGLSPTEPSGLAIWEMCIFPGSIRYTVQAASRAIKQINEHKCSTGNPKSPERSQE